MIKTLGIVGNSYSREFKELFKSFLDIEIFTIVHDTSLVLECDAILFTGGHDVSPELYGQSNTSSATLLGRDMVETFILTSAINSNIKIMGVCRGHQFINAYLGGTLSQDLLDAHDSIHSLDRVHIKGNLNPLEFTLVNSTHHQGVVSPGRDLIPLAYHKRIVESTLSKNGRILTMQFHPEFENFPKESIIGFQNLIKGFLL